MAATAIHSNHFNGLNSVQNSAKNNEAMSSAVQGSNNAEFKQELPDSNPEEDQKEVDIVINNVVCSFNVRCHLNLREIALRGLNVEYRKENGMVTMKLRQPYTTANIWNSSYF